MKLPTVTVLMPVYNAELYLSVAVESILTQTLKDFEFLIINDGSADKSPEILKKYAAQDKRIKILAQENQGLVVSLNRGIKEASGKYIARQDADDKSAPDRLKKQVEFLKTHPKVVIAGSCISVIDEKSRIMYRHALLLNDPELRQELLVRSPFAHGSVIFEREIAIEAGLYQQSSWPTEDYDFWLRLSALGEMANLEEDLYLYREHKAGISKKNANLQIKKIESVRSRAWQQRSRLLPKRKINLDNYKSLNMGQERIERIVDNTVFVSKLAWGNNQKSLAFKNMSMLAGHRVTYKKAAGKIKRRIKK